MSLTHDAALRLEDSKPHLRHTLGSLSIPYLARKAADTRRVDGQGLEAPGDLTLCTLSTINNKQLQ